MSLGPVRVTEVGPRDGLQNERVLVPVAAKIAFVEALVGAGVRHIEVTSFVHPDRVPALADAEAVVAGVRREEGVQYVALTPNVRGYDRARDAGCPTVAVFTAASDPFTRANIGVDVETSLSRFATVAERARADGVAVRGYVSTAFACPYAGAVEPQRVVEVARSLVDMGCYEVSLGDTIGVARPHEVRALLELLRTELDLGLVALHFHDTWGMATANVVEGLAMGVRSFDASAGGLGGCPYSPGATGNLATEDLVYLLDGLGYETGIDLEGVVAAAADLGTHLDRELPSRVHHAVLARQRRLQEDGDTCS